MEQILPDKYRSMKEDDLRSRINEVRDHFGDELVILTHHYQRQEIVDLGDYKGDSLKLAREAADNDRAKYIVFCGVHFMAESAAVLARPEQAVFIPEMTAGCPMADMAERDQVERAWSELSAVVDISTVTPITYVNSTAGVKAFCGANKGATCTSSNADKVFEWAFSERDRILFMPDEHLGDNTAAKLGRGPVAVWNPDKEMGGLRQNQIEKASVIVWKGHCHVHTNFKVEQVKKARKEYEGCKVVVHPECPRPVVEAADANGSTEGIIKYAEQAEPGATIVVGTEIHLVNRLARIHEPDKRIVPLARSLCPNMYKINRHNLCWIMDSIMEGPDAWVNRVTVPDDVKRDAEKALSRMLEIPS